jgi:hypothetical protein
MSDFEKAYHIRLNNLATKAWDAAGVASDNDAHLMSEAFRFEMRRYHRVDGGKNAKNQDVWFCWSIRKDKAGYFYSWVEVHGAKKMWRYKLASRRTKIGARDLAYDRQNAWVAK